MPVHLTLPPCKLCGRDLGQRSIWTSDGSAQTVCGGPQNPNTGVQSIYVFAWCMRFVVTTKSANSLSFGQLYRHMLGDQATANAAYREGWA